MFSLLRRLCMPRLRTSSFILLWAGTAIHLFTVCIAASIDGCLSAGLSLVFPVTAQVYWMLKLWQSSGTYLNFFTMTCLVYFAAWLVSFLDPARRNPGKLYLIEGGKDHEVTLIDSMRRRVKRTDQHAFRIVNSRAVQARRQSQGLFS
jgi:hypothetical protein